VAVAVPVPVAAVAAGAARAAHSSGGDGGGGGGGGGGGVELRPECGDLLGAQRRRRTLVGLRLRGAAAEGPAQQAAAVGEHAARRVGSTRGARRARSVQRRAAPDVRALAAPVAARAAPLAPDYREAGARSAYDVFCCCRAWGFGAPRDRGRGLILAVRRLNGGAFMRQENRRNALMARCGVTAPFLTAAADGAADARLQSLRQAGLEGPWRQSA
jgi:hypothetical protein